MVHQPGQAMGRVQNGGFGSNRYWAGWGSPRPALGSQTCAVCFNAILRYFAGSVNWWAGMKNGGFGGMSASGGWLRGCWLPGPPAAAF